MQTSVSTAAVIARINRRLKPDYEMLRRSRPRWRSTVGDYYVVDLYHNMILQTHVDVEAFGREVGALKGFEEVAQA
jgi:hypothetical protein